MRKLLILLLALQGASPALSADLEVCQLHAIAAEIVMMRRQQSADSLEDYVLEVTGNQTLSPPMKELVTSMAMDAWFWTRFETRSLREDAITRFKDLAFRQCMTL